MSCLKGLLLGTRFLVMILLLGWKLHCPIRKSFYLAVSVIILFFERNKYNTRTWVAELNSNPSVAQPSSAIHNIYLIFLLQQICCLHRAHPPQWPPRWWKKNWGQNLGQKDIQGQLFLVMIPLIVANWLKTLLYGSRFLWFSPLLSQIIMP